MRDLEAIVGVPNKIKPVALSRNRLESSGKENLQNSIEFAGLVEPLPVAALPAARQDGVCSGLIGLIAVPHRANGCARSIDG